MTVRDIRLRDLSAIDIRFEELQETFPEVFVDGTFDRERLIELLSGVGHQQQDRSWFGLYWPDKDTCLNLLRTPSRGTLVPDIKNSLYFDKAKHVVITGDNLESMKLMQKAYFGKFKMIYLNPPYNLPTDSIYEDDYSDPIGGYLKYLEKLSVTKEGAAKPSRDMSGRLHSKWLSMMLPRLFVIRNLLASDGVIFVSIDDHEVHHLRMLMDEIFGPENFVSNLIWVKRYSPAPDAKEIGYMHENILCYRRSDAFEAALLPMTDAQTKRYKNPDRDPRGRWKAADYTCRYTAEERPTLYYAIFDPNTGKKVWPKKTRVWACSEAEHQVNVKENRLWWPPESSVPAKKKFLSEIRQGATPQSLLDHKLVGHTDEATKEFRKWFPDLKLAPKPTRLIRHLLRIANVKSGELVLDCFAGPGTTAEAVALANKHDGLGARFVTIQLPESIPGIKKMTMADVARERAVRAQKALDESGREGIRAFSLTSSCFKTWAGREIAEADKLANHISLIADNVVAGRSDLEILSEIFLRSGLPLTAKIESLKCPGGQFFRVGQGSLIVCLEKEINIGLIREMAAHKPEQLICLDTAFKGKDQDKLNAFNELRAKGIELATV